MGVKLLVFLPVVVSLVSYGEGGAGWDGGLFWRSVILGLDLALCRRALDNAVTGYLWSYPS